MKPASSTAETIFSQSIAIGDAVERAAFLDRACADDPVLRSQVEALVANHFRAGSFLEQPAVSVGVTIDQPGVELPDTQIGPYKLLQEIGEGGMGVVYMAEQAQPVRRTVALKIIKPGMDTRQVIARFEAERQALALMDHPNIAKVLDAGTTDVGRPYFVMELVKGLPITKYCDERHLPLIERLQLFLLVCQAVQHAHQKGVIHRDLKPSNVMVALYDGRPVPKVIDFGVAKATGPKLTERTLFTEFGAVIGTLEYMSPEQAELNQLDVDTRSDVYSLGVLLYELLTGSTPLDRKRLEKSALQEVLRVIREDEPPKPSTRLSTTDQLASIAANRGVEPKKLTGTVRGELDWIVMKALEKDRNRRYETASSFANDIERHLRNEPVLAGPPSAAYRLRKLAGRHRVALAIGTGFVLLLAAATAVSSWQAVRATRAERQVAQERDLVLAERDRKEEALRATEEARNDESKQRSEAVKQQRIAEERLAGGLIAVGDGELALGHTDARNAYRENLDISRRLGMSELSAKTGLLASYADQPAPLLGKDGARGGVGGFEGNPSGWLRVAFSPDGRSAASASTNGPLKIWDVFTGNAIRTFSSNGSRIYDVKFSPDGRTLLTGSRDGTLTLWDVAKGSLIRSIRGHNASVRTVAFSADGTRAATAGEDHTILLWDVADWHEAHRFKMPSAVMCVAFSPDGSRLISGGDPDHTVRMFDLASGEETQNWEDPQTLTIDAVAFSPDGRALVYGLFAHQIIQRDALSGKVLWTVNSHDGAIIDVAYSPNGRYILSASNDKTMRLWDSASGAQLRIWTGHDHSVHSATFSPDGRFILSSDEGGAIKLWDLRGAEDIPKLRGHTERVTSLATGFDGRTVLSGSFDKSIRLWDVATCRLLRTVATGDSPVWGAAMSRDSRTAVTAHENGKLVIWDVASGERRRELVGHSDIVTSVALSPDETTALSSSSDRTLKLWDLVSGENIRTLSGHRDKVRRVAYSADGRTAVSAGFDSVLKSWDVATGRLLNTFPGHRHWVIGCAISPDGRLVASGSFDRRWGLWDLETGRNLHFSAEATDIISSVAFSPDGELLFCSCLGGHVGLWTVANRRPVRDFKLDTKGETSVTFCSQETALTGSLDGRIWRWDWDRPARYEQFEKSLPVARKALAHDPNNGDALAEFGRWYAFRGVFEWAIELLEKAQEHGAKISSLELARCYWQLDRRSDAEHEFREAMKKHEAPDDYLDICIAAVEKPQDPSVQSAEPAQ